jgi:hypothetical protein
MANRKSLLNKIFKARSSRESAAAIGDGAAGAASRFVELMTAAIANVLAALQKTESSGDLWAEFCDRPQIPGSCASAAAVVKLVPNRTRKVG